jgi:hypothetical protein
MIDRIFHRTPPVIQKSKGVFVPLLKNQRVEERDRRAGVGRTSGNISSKAPVSYLGHLAGF